MATTNLAPGEIAMGVICGKGQFTPTLVAMTNELLEEQAQAGVS